VFGPRAEFPPSGQIFQSRVYAEDLPQRLKALSAHFVDRIAYDLDYRIRGDGGALIGARPRPRRIRRRRQAGAPGRHAARDHVAQRKGSEVEYLANFDPLTGHFNASRLRESLDHAIEYAVRYKAPGAFLLVGAALPDQRRVRLEHGQRFADRHRPAARTQPARVRHDRARGRRPFRARRPAQCPESGCLAADRLLTAVCGAPVDMLDGPLHVTASAGAVLFLEQGPSAVEVMARAELALHEAKRAGRNRYAIFSASPAQRELHQRLVAISSDVQAALKDERLVFAFQPDNVDDTHVVDHLTNA